MRIGRGEQAAEALDAMVAAEQTVEGVPAAGLATTLVEQSAADIADQLPLLGAVNAILDGASNPKDVIAGAVLPRRS